MPFPLTRLTDQAKSDYIVIVMAYDTSYSKEKISSAPEVLSTPKRLSDGAVYALVIFAMALFAGAFYAAKAAVVIVPPITLTFLRFLVALALLIPLFLRQPKTQIVPATRDLPLLFLIGATGMFLYHYLFFVSLETTSPVNSSVLGSFGPIMTSVMAVLIIHEPFRLQRFGALFLALAGVLVTLCNGNLSLLASLQFNRGDLVMLTGVVCLAFYNTVSKKALARYTPTTVLTFAIASAVLLSAPGFVIHFGEIPWKSATLWGATLYMGIFPSFIGYLSMQVAIKQIGVSRTAPFVNVTPVFSILIAVLFFGTASVSLAQIVSCAMIIAGVFWNSRIV